MPEHSNDNDQEQSQNLNDDDGGFHFAPISLNYGALTINSGQDFANLGGNINLFGNSNRIAPGNLSMDINGESYSMNYQGGLPINGNFGGLSLTNARAENISISNGNLSNFTVKADQLSFGSYLTLSDITATKQGDGTFQVQATGGKTLDVLGHTVDMSNANPVITIGADGTLQTVEISGVSAGGVTVETITMDSGGGSLTMRNANVDLPETLGEILTVDFAEMTMGTSGITGTGSIDQADKIQLLNNTLDVENFQGSVEVNNDNWIVDVLGSINYSPNENLTVTGGGHFVYNSTAGAPDVSLQDGTLNGNISGIAITGTGIEYDTTSDVIKMATGQATVPLLGDRLSVDATVTNAQYSSTEGFDFESVALTNAGAGLELFPGFVMNVQSVAITKEDANNYTFALENGALDFSSGDVNGAATISVWYNDTSNFRGEITGNPNIQTPFADLQVNGNVTFDANSVALDGVTISVKNVGPASEAIQATGSGITWDTEGLKIASIETALPPIGDLQLEANAQNIVIGSAGITGGTGQITSADGITFGNGALSISGLQSEIGVTSEGWSVYALAELGVAADGITASGTVTVDYNAGGEPSVTFDADGSLSADLGGVGITATGLSYSTSDNTLNIGNTDITLPEIQGESIPEIQASASNLSLGPDGFNFDSIGLTAQGPLVLFQGLSINDLSGTVTNEGGTYGMNMTSSSIDMGTSGLEGGASNVTYSFQNGESSFEMQGFNVSSNVFSLTASDSQYADNAFSINAANFNVKNLGPAFPGETPVSGAVENIVLNSEGLTVGSFDVDLPQVGDLNLKASMSNLAVSAGAISLGSGEIKQEGDLSFGGGALTLSELQSTITADNNAWGINVQAGVGISAGGVEADLNAVIDYSQSGEAVFSLAEGSKVTANLPGDVKIEATDLTYSTSDNTLRVGNVDVDLPQLSAGDTAVDLTTTVTDMSIGPEGFNIGGVQVAASGNISLFPGFDITGFTGGLTAEGGNYGVNLSGGLSLTGPLSGGATNVTFDYNSGGETSLSVDGFNLSSNLFEFTADSSTFDTNSQQLDITASTFTAKNIGPLSDINGTAEGIKFNAQGLTVDSASIGLPPIGTVNATLGLEDLNVGEGGITLGEGNLTTEGDVSLAGGALSVRRFRGEVNLEGGSTWSVAASGSLRINNVANTTASGDLTVSYTNAEGGQSPSVTLEDGAIETSIGGVVLSATGVSMGTDTSVVNIDEANLELPDLTGGEGEGVNATMTGVTFGAQGFDFTSIGINAPGPFELMPGALSVSGLSGSLTKNGQDFDINASGTADLTMAGLEGGASVTYERTGGESSFTLNQFNLSTNLFDFEVSEAAYADNKVSIDSASFNLKNLGPAGDGLQADATGLELSRNKFEASRIEADFPQVGNVNISAIVEGLRVSGGNISGRGTIETDADLSLAGGAVSVTNLGGSVRLANDDWGVSVTGELGLNVPNAEAGGNVTISYDSQTGANVEIANGSFGLTYPGVTMTGSGISFNYQEDELRVDTASINLPALGDSGVETTVEGFSVKDGDVDFESITVNVNQSLEIVPGLNARLESGSLEKQGGTLQANIGIGVDFSASNLNISGSGDGTLGYNLTNGEFSGSLDSLSLDTSVFDLRIQNGAEINQDGFHLGQVILGFSDNFDPSEAAAFIPRIGEFSHMALQALKGVDVVATDVVYNNEDGFSIGDWSLSFARVDFDFMGLNGHMDLANNSFGIGGSYTFDKSIRTPEIDIPIPGVPPQVHAIAYAGLSAGVTLSANITGSGEPDSDVWNVRGELNASGRLSGMIGLGLEASLEVPLAGELASASAALEPSINVPFDIGAGIGMGITYDGDSVQLADNGLTFDYHANAGLNVALDLVLEASVGPFSGRLPIELGRIELATITITGESIADNFSEIMSKLESEAILRFGSTEYKKNF
ncbi:MAG: hypothetical protein GY810_06250 [Aureispira sp.]|nr:hypothetical protein [Aureispira sp.]